MMFIGICLVLLLGMLLGAMLVGPWLGWNAALQYQYRRFCLYAADEAADELCAWDTAFGEAHEQSMSQVWKEMLVDADPRYDGAEV